MNLWRAPDWLFLDKDENYHDQRKDDNNHRDGLKNTLFMVPYFKAFNFKFPDILLPGGWAE